MNQRLKGRDAEEIDVSQVQEAQKESVTPTESKLLDELQALRQGLYDAQKEIKRLNAISDKNRGAAYDHENRDKSFKGHLRHLGDPLDPIVEWKSVRNVSHVDPQNGNLVQDQRIWVRTMKGNEREMDISEWSMGRSNIVPMKFLKMDADRNICDIQLSDDGGKSYVGEILKDFPMTFVNP